jgi:hypothetical protein
MKNGAHKRRLVRCNYIKKIGLLIDNNWAEREAIQSRADRALDYIGAGHAVADLLTKRQDTC